MKISKAKKKLQDETLDRTKTVLAICAHILEEKARRQKRQYLFKPDEIDNERMASVISKIIALPSDRAQIALEEMITGRRPVDSAYHASLKSLPNLDPAVLDERVA